MLSVGRIESYWIFLFFSRFVFFFASREFPCGPAVLMVSLMSFTPVVLLLVAPLLAGADENTGPRVMRNECRYRRGGAIHWRGNSAAAAHKFHRYVRFFFLHFLITPIFIHFKCAVVCC